MNVEHEPTVDPLETPIGGGGDFVVSGRFRKARVKPIFTYGAYRGSGALRVSSRGIEVLGRRVRPLSIRLTVGIVLFVIPLVLTAGRFAPGFIPIYLLMEYVWLERGDMILPWSSVIRVASDRRRLLVSIHGEKDGDCVVMRTDGIDAFLNALNLYAPGRDLDQDASHETDGGHVRKQMESSLSNQRARSSGAASPPHADAQAEAPVSIRRTIRTHAWGLPAVIAGVALLSAAITLAVVRHGPGAQTAVPSAVAALRTGQASAPVATPTDALALAANSFSNGRETGTLTIRMDSWACRRSPEVVPERARSLRLVFSTDKDANTIVAIATLTTAVYREPCQWQMSFSFDLPEDVDFFYVQLGRGQWPPYSTSDLPLSLGYDLRQVDQKYNFFNP